MLKNDEAFLLVLQKCYHRSQMIILDFESARPDSFYFNGSTKANWQSTHKGYVVLNASEKSQRV
jgi:hypothetical protein